MQITQETRKLRVQRHLRPQVKYVTAPIYKKLTPDSATPDFTKIQHDFKQLILVPRQMYRQTDGHGLHTLFLFRKEVLKAIMSVLHGEITLVCLTFSPQSQSSSDIVRSKRAALR